MNDFDDDLYTIVINGDEPQNLPIPDKSSAESKPQTTPKPPVKEPEEQNAYQIEIKGGPAEKPLSVPPKATVPQAASSFDTSGLDPKRADKLKMVYDSIIEMNHGPLKGNFEQQLRDLSDFSVKEAEYVKFRCYWPTYDAMSESQFNWYFHWRGLVRMFIYPPNDLSYIFLYIYELLNGVGMKDAEDGFNRLWRLWSAYRKAYPTLDTYLQNWVRDYIFYYLKDGSVSDYIAKIEDNELRSRFFEYEVEHLILHPDGVIPLDILKRLSDYKFIENKFFSDENSALAEEFLTSVAGQMDLYMRKTRGKSVFELFSQGCRIERTVFPFKNAVFCGVKKTISSSYISYEECRRLRDFITSVMRHACNRFRAFKGYRGKVRVQFYLKELLEYENKIIDILFYEYQKREAVKNIKKVEIDRDKLESLIADSEDVKNRLLDGAALDEAPVSEPIAQTELISESVIKEQENNHPDENTEDDEFSQFISSLSETGQKILRFIYTEKPEMAALESRFSGIFISVEIDSINEAALDTLGDIILIENDSGEGKAYQVSEDFENDTEEYFKMNKSDKS